MLSIDNMHFKYAILSLVASSAGYVSATAIYHRHNGNMALVSEVCVYTCPSVSLIILFGTNKKRAHLTSNQTALEAASQAQIRSVVNTTAPTNNTPTTPTNETVTPYEDCGVPQDVLESALARLGPLNFSCEEVNQLKEEGLV